MLDEDKTIDATCMLQARGVVGFFNAKPLSTREVHEWQVWGWRVGDVGKSCFSIDGRGGITSNSH